ncbi:hypothetical protein DOM22_02625 [Bdellovibrio sp. ZAP7]|uniref:helix-turn-helix domain-containing protein n=1 Tax=Bdellovibrio sp. ZAP7 TaxID=2231053 RepID=UPI001157EE4F|nr:helix-turn-helix domain-containing protein [Bdellovibrio sp. ZAP7]QDK44127.1 hypothetical protein DOM22_02625 [Bdellovibrio sp. ZAP7]
MKQRSEYFKKILTNEYQRRLQQTGKYSFRAFAHSLEIDPSSLHDIMKGERKVGEKVIRKLGEKIGMTLAEVEELLAKK